MSSTREQRRRATLEAPPLEVESTQCDIDIIEVDDDMAVEPSASPVYGLTLLPPLPESSDAHNPN